MHQRRPQNPNNNPRIHTYTRARTDGLAKGRQAWHATYNRIYLLHELYRLRHQHRYRWVLFMDPGALSDQNLFKCWKVVS